MRAEDFEDQRTLVAWLRERPRRDAVVIAHRTALRALPLWGAAMGEDWARKGDLTALPPTLDNILGYISLEIDRLQSRNYRDAEDAAEAQREIRVLTTIHVALSRLETLVPDGADMPEADAEQAEKLTRPVFRRVREWPRAKPGTFDDNAADLVDRAYRAAMVGGFACLAPMVGAAPDKALIAGAVVFGGKKIIDSVKAAKDAFGPVK
ncbi:MULTISPECIES: hypothetical protein [unclassified Mameliella]|uniref:hypothetical protein n=1 Tax=unclassified Mameliella TaxID=2630630 RepID=UPI00273DB548|nr:MULTISPECIES: hypothetical protein [unclassified Mameliella]